MEYNLGFKAIKSVMVSAGNSSLYLRTVNLFCLLNRGWFSG